MRTSKEEPIQIEGNASRISRHASDVEDGNDKSLQPSVDDDPEFSHREQRKIVHRIDRRLVIMTGVIYMVSLMDRSNLPNAAIAGMNVDLNLNTGFRYSTIALVFFVTYTIFQPPATILTRKIGPRQFLSGLCVAWGLVMIGFGFVQSWIVLIPLRLLLGLFEAGYFPGVVYLISTWYSRFDMQKRYAGFYVLGTVASGGSGILAYGLQQMDGLANYEGWRWIFIIEGIVTVVVGFIAYIFLIDFPDRAIEKKHWGFLKSNEIEFILRRINRDRNDAVGEKWNLKAWASSGTDWKIWGFGLCFFCLTTMAYAISFFLPIILRENMGMTVGEAQMLSAPPYVFAALVMLGCAWAGDRYHIRGPLLLINCTLGIIGLPLLGWAPQPGVRYFGTFLICASANGGIPTVMAYQANNIRGHWKRAFASATLIGMGGVGGIAGSLIFRQQDRPHYRPGIFAGLACNFVIIIVVVINSIVFKKMNRAADRGRAVLEGDANFRYTI